jgi:hypothetical protein
MKTEQFQCLTIWQKCRHANQFAVADRHWAANAGLKWRRDLATAEDDGAHHIAQKSHAEEHQL